MTEPHPVRRRNRSIGAVLAGLIVVVVFSVGTDAALRAAGIFSGSGDLMDDPLFVLATLYRCVYGIAGGHLTARLAPNRPMPHALAGGLVGVVIGIVGAVATWNSAPSLGPHWYPLALIVTALPCAWAGGKLLDLRPATRID